MPRIIVLRWGHRVQRDVRLTSHVALAARALGASGFCLSDTVDNRIRATVEKVSKTWGGDFLFSMGQPWKQIVRDWKIEGGITVHLTVYGENIQSSDVLDHIKDSKRDILLLVGSQKVPREFFSSEVSDFNISIGNQPHSEVSAIAIFLDRFFEGEELTRRFENAELNVVPQKKGKKTSSND